MAALSNDAPPGDVPTPEVSLVLPCYNEVNLLGSTVTNLVTGLDERSVGYEIIVMENGSTDGTLRLGRMLAAQLEQVRVLHLARSDYGAALASGFLAARGEVVVNFDVDYYDLSFFDSARALLAGGDAAMVLASKRAPGASDRRPVHRRVLTAGFTGALRVLLGMSVTDAHGMKAMRRDLLSPVVSSCTMRGSLFDVELVVRAIRAGLAVRELPATVVERRPPRSSVAARTVESLLGALRLRAMLGPSGRPRDGLSEVVPKALRPLTGGHRKARAE